jgi:hypothetical protein
MLYKYFEELPTQHTGNLLVTITKKLEKTALDQHKYFILV